MKYYVVFALLVVLQCCYCSPYRPRYDGDEGDAPPYGSEDYVVDDKTHKIGGGFNLGANLGLGLGVGKNGLHAGLQKGLNFDWNGYAGTRNTHLRRQRPIYGFNPYGYQQSGGQNDY